MRRPSDLCYGGCVVQPGGPLVRAAPYAEKFSEGAFLCAPSTINGTTFQLFKKGSIKKLAAISYSASTDTAKLDPTGSLQGGATYKAVVSTGAKDLAGNPLDQNSTTTGLQQMAWYFTVRR